MVVVVVVVVVGVVVVGGVYTVRVSGAMGQSRDSSGDFLLIELIIQCVQTTVAPAAR